MNMFFVDLCLPFGLRSSVNRFTQLSDTLSWIMKHNYSINYSTHYLDDFFIAGPPRSNSCALDLQRTITLFKKLGVPLALDKTEGPTTCLTYLGIEIDSTSMQLRLPADKFKALLSLINTWINKKKCTKRDLLSLIGQLAFASKVIPSGRTFLRRLIDLSSSVSKLGHHISLNTEAREDIKWWLDFLPSWNGKHRILNNQVTLCPDISLYTDASGNIGFGIYNNGHWASEKWPPHFDNYSIQFKELFPIYVACILWPHSLAGKRILFHCDNKAVVDIWASNTSKCPLMTSLLRKLFFIAAQHEFTVNIKHLAGINNSIADSLSRFQMVKFRHLAPEADPLPTAIPDIVWKI